MDKDCDFNLAEENNYSIISNDDLQEIEQFTDYSSFALTSHPKKVYNDASNNSNIRNTNYSNSKLQPSSSNLLDNIPIQNGSSTGNVATEEAFRQYIDQFTAYLVKHDPRSLHYLMNNINKRKNADLDFNDMGRTTPLLFSKMHALCRLDFPGLLYQLIPNGLSESGGMITITDDVYPKYYDFNFDDYPGPLSVEKTTEEQIFYYLKDQTSMEYQDVLTSDWNSEKLLINYLELLIKEDGKPRMSNVVRLLNDGVETKTSEFEKGYKSYDSVSRNSYSRASSRATSRASSRAPSPENKEIIDNDLPQNPLETPKGPGSVSSAVRRAVTTASQDQKLYQNMDKYREYIWSGRFEEAVNFAMRAGIWDHAFALALRMNNSTLVTEILTSFSRHAIHSHDPLFTMHELMAARPPRIVATNRGFSNTDMDQWRSHLSMILAVRKFRPEESRHAIECMGDKLVLLRSYFAGHLCYLLADTAFGIDKSAHKYRRKYDLLGWESSTSNIPAQKSTYDNCHKLFTGIQYWHSAPEQSIKLTEIYEYIVKLRDDDSHKSLSIHLIPYKYLMAFRLLALQKTRSAYEYCHNIGEILGSRDINWLQCESVNFHIVSNLRNLSYKLHSRLTAEEDYDDARSVNNSWLENINKVYCQFCDRYKLWNPMNSKWTLLDVIEHKTVDSSEIGAESVFSGRSVAVDRVDPVVYSHQAPPQEYQESGSKRMVSDGNVPGSHSYQHQSQHQQPPHEFGSRRNGPRTHDNVSGGHTLQDHSHQQQPLNESMSRRIGPVDNIAPTYGNVSVSHTHQNHSHHQQPPHDSMSRRIVSDVNQGPPYGNVSVSHTHQDQSHHQQIPHESVIKRMVPDGNLPRTYGGVPIGTTHHQQPPHESVSGRVMPDANLPRTHGNAPVSQPHHDLPHKHSLSNQAHVTPRTSTSDQSSLNQDIHQYHGSQEVPSKNVASRYPFTGNNFCDIPPPSELPAEMIMTSPPRRYDIKSTTSTNVDWAVRDRQPVPSDYPQHYNNPYTSVSPPTNADPNLFHEPHNLSQVPVLSQRNASYSRVNTNYDTQSQYRNNDEHSVDSSAFLPSMFMPSATDDMRASNETVDCFAVMPPSNRSRSQSNGSVGSADSQNKGASRHSISRSRNSSESKDTKVALSSHVSSRSLETTKEEIEHQKQEQQKNEAPSIEQKKSGWNFFGYFSSKVKGAHLPDDNQKPLEYDVVTNRWINKSDPQTEKPPSPPPKIPVVDGQAQYGYSSPQNQYQAGGPQSSLSRYRQAAPNVRPSLNTPTPALPSYGAQAPITYQQAPQPNNNNDYGDQRQYSLDPVSQFNNDGQFNYPAVNYQMETNAPYDSNNYHTNYQTMMNQ